MFEQYIGKKMSEKDIFEKFEGLAVTVKHDESQYPLRSYIIEFIGTPEEAYEKMKKSLNEGNASFVCYGLPLRKGEGVIWKSRISLQELVGVWNTSVTADGGMSNEMMILKSNGTGLFAEANMGPYFGTLITWYVENDILFINTIDRNICKKEIVYTPDVIVPCMSREERHFTELLTGAYGLKFYRNISDDTLAELEEEACSIYEYMLAKCVVVK